MTLYKLFVRRKVLQLIDDACVGSQILRIQVGVNCKPRTDACKGPLANTTQISLDDCKRRTDRRHYSRTRATQENTAQK